MRHPLRQLIRHVIVESRLSDAHDRYPEHAELIDSLAGSDPSGNHAYLTWMARRAVDDSEDANDVIDATIVFHKMRGRLQKRDINAYRTLQELQNAVNDTSIGPRSREAAKAGSRTVLDDGRWTVVEVTNPEAACAYGAGTRWCISATRSHNYFKQYARSNTHFYFIIDRRDAAERWALALVPIDAASGRGGRGTGTLFHRDDARGVGWHAELFDAGDRSISPAAFFAGKPRLRDAIVADITRPTASLMTREAQLDAQYKELKSAALTDPSVLDDPSVPIGLIVRFAKENPDVFKLSDRHVTRALRSASDAGLMYDLLSIEALSIDARSVMRLASHADPEIRAKVAEHVSVTREALDALAGDVSTKVRSAVARHASASHATLDRLANDDDHDIRYAVAQNASVSRKTLDRLANDDHPSVRRSVTWNASASRETLDRFANDDDPSIRRGVAQNASASREALDRLANDNDPSVRRGVARNTSASREMLDRLANDDDPSIRYNVAINASASRETLDLLANDNKLYVRSAVAGNTSTSRETLERLANDDSPSVRYNVAKNASASRETLEQLTNDNDPSVHYNAQKTLITHKRTHKR